MFPENFFAGLAGGIFSTVVDAFIGLFLTPLTALVDIIYKALGGT